MKNRSQAPVKIAAAMHLAAIAFPGQIGRLLACFAIHGGSNFRIVAWAIPWLREEGVGRKYRGHARAVRVDQAPKANPYVSYVLAVGLALAAHLVRLALDPMLGPTRPFVTWFPVIALAAVLGGFGPSLLVIAAGLFGGNYFLSAHRFEIPFLGSEPGAFASDATYLACALVIAATVAALHRTAKRSEQLAAESEVATRRLRIHYTVTSALSRAESIKDAAGEILNGICEVTGSDVAALWTLNRAAGVLECGEVIACPSNAFGRFVAATRESSFGCGAGLPGRAWQKAEPIWIEDVTRDGNFPRAKVAVAEDLHAAFAAPIKHGAEVFGVIEFFSAKVLPPDPSLLEMLGDFCLQLGQFADRKRADQDRWRLAAIVDSSDDAIISKDLDGRIMSWNSGAEQMFGYTAREMVGASMITLLPPENRDEERQILENVRQKKGIRNIDAQRVTKNRQRIDVAITVSPVMDSEGKVIGASSILRDITEKKNAENELRRGKELLQDQRDILSAVVTGTPLDDILEQLTESVEKRSQRPCMATILLVADDGRRLKPVAGKRAPARWTELIADLEIGPEVGACGSAAFHKKRILTEDVQKDPRWRGFQETAAACNLAACWSTPILSSDNRTLGTFAVYYPSPGVPSPSEIDYIEVLTRTAAIAIERKASEKALETAHEELECQVEQRTASLREALTELEAFAYSVSHDLRAPLRAMREYATALMEDYGQTVPSEAAEYLRKISRGCTRMDKLVQDVLAVTALSRTPAPCARIDLDSFVHDIVAQYPNLEGKVDMISPLGFALGHEGLLGQAIANLLGNAVKFVPTERRPRVRVWSEARADKVRLCIEDNGIGIPAEYHPKIFRMFGRIHPETKFEGTGIGLTIVKTAVQKMNGEVGIVSDGANGSTFWIELPAA